MPTVKIEAQLSKEDLLEAVQQLSLSELEQFTQDIIAVQAKQKANNLSANETELLFKINQNLNKNKLDKYKLLITKRNQEILTEKEYQELLLLTNEVEKHQAQRLEYLAQLTQIRQVSLSNLIIQLGIQTNSND